MLTAWCVAQTDTIVDAAMDEGFLKTLDRMDDVEEHVVRVTKGPPHVTEEEVALLRCALVLCSHFATPLSTAFPCIPHRVCTKLVTLPLVAINIIVLLCVIFIFILCLMCFDAMTI